MRQSKHSGEVYWFVKCETKLREGAHVFAVEKNHPVGGSLFGGDGGALRFALGLLALCAGAATRRRCPAAKNADAVAFFMRLREKL